MKNIKVQNNEALAKSMKSHFGYWTDDSIVNAFITYPKNKTIDDLGLIAATCSFYSNVGTFRLDIQITEKNKELYSSHVIDGNKIILT